MGVIVFFSSLSFYHGLDMFWATRDALVINGSYPGFFTSSSGIKTHLLTETLTSWPSPKVFFWSFVGSKKTQPTNQPNNKVTCFNIHWMSTLSVGKSILYWITGMYLVYCVFIIWYNDVLKSIISGHIHVYKKNIIDGYTILHYTNN